MPIPPMPDDEQFTNYLRQFRPLPAGPLPAKKPVGAKRWWGFSLAAAAALAMVVVSIAMINRRHQPVAPRTSESVVGGEQLSNAKPLTIGGANDLLVHAQSFQSAVDGVAFQRQRNPLPKGSRSALATLSKEEIKL